MLTERWTDRAVDFAYENKREIIRVPVDPGARSSSAALTDGGRAELELRATGAAWEERWTGDYIFENERRSCRTMRDRAPELTSTAKEVEPGQRRVAVKVVDIFGNDIMTIVDVMVGQGKRKRI